MAARAYDLMFSDDEDDGIPSRNHADNLMFYDEFNDFIPRSRVLRQRHNFFDEYDDVDFKTRFRLSKESALNVLNEIEDELEFPTDRNNAVSPMNQLLLALRYYATGSFFLTVGDSHGVSISTTHRIVHRVSKALANLRTKYIKFPTTESEIRATQLGIYGIARFPRAIGLMDCTHIRLQSPGGDNAEVFRNRKGYYSLNVQAICDVDLQFLNIVSRWPGSAHDSTVYYASKIRAQLDNGLFGDAILLGDSGYSLSPHLMVPIENPVSQSQRLYNESQIRSRNCAERLFGIWKRRFPVLALGFRIDLQRVFPIIAATAVLHNILRTANDSQPPDEVDLQLPLPWNELFAMGQIPAPIIRITTQSGRTRRLTPGEIARNQIVTEYFERLQ